MLHALLYCMLFGLKLCKSYYNSVNLSKFFFKSIYLYYVLQFRWLKREISPHTTLQQLETIVLLKLVLWVGLLIEVELNRF